MIQDTDIMLAIWHLTPRPGEYTTIKEIGEYLEEIFEVEKLDFDLHKKIKNLSSPECYETVVSIERAIRNPRGRSSNGIELHDETITRTRTAFLMMELASHAQHHKLPLKASVTATVKKGLKYTNLTEEQIRHQIKRFETIKYPYLEIDYDDDNYETHYKLSRRYLFEEVYINELNRNFST